MIDTYNSGFLPPIYSRAHANISIRRHMSKRMTVNVSYGIRLEQKYSAYDAVKIKRSKQV